MKQSRWFGSILFLLLTAILFTSVCANAQRGALTTPRGLDQLTQEADLIIHGRVSSVKVEPHPQFKNLMTVVVTMNVADTLKGSPRKTTQFRQFIWDIRDKLDAARYRKGEELLLMLRPVSKYGLTSPVGLEQGRFRILRDAKGNETAVNGTGNVGLFQSVASRAQAKGMRLPSGAAAMVNQQTSGPVPLSDLKDAIRSMGGSK